MRVERSKNQTNRTGPDRPFGLVPSGAKSPVTGFS
jgi:hypothetical protein